MINAQLKLISPRKVETFFSDIAIESENVLVRPEVLSICKADIRYFYGLRDAKILKKKLPLTLIHEACGKVLYDPDGNMKKGDRVILLPNIPGKDDRAEENYRLDSIFRSSKADGFMQEVMSLPPSQVLLYENIPDEIAAFTEFISVGVHAVSSYLKRMKNPPRRIGVWGDGGLGYIVSALLKFYLPDVHVSVIGVHRTKLELFRFADELHTIDEISPDCGIWFDDVFECVGGAASEDAISQMIDVINPEGIINLLGVSENPVAVNTRMVLEKGLTLIGRSRSGRADFEETVRILQTNEKLTRRMKVLISDVMEIRDIEDINRAFDRAKSVDYKVILKWEM
ncbi:MAG: alcohol dehydrogenase catalytic domain-containing protein [Lachnospiraceae bacterium]|nr:alcohol dehydrogenase catalytic domain-containing protein [Lachnospiraceae bacterium]